MFVHVPKTAGSTVNRHLADGLAPGAEHVEHWIDDPRIAGPRLAELRYVSGHLAAPVFLERVRELTDRPVRLATVVRDPTAQVRSHYNWLIEIYHRGEQFYEGHNETAKAISARLRATDHADPHRVVEQLELASGLFLDIQSSFVVGARDPVDAARVDPARIDAALDAFETVATERGLAGLVEQLTGRPCGTVRRENTSRYHVPPEVFDHPVVQEFLAERNASDLALYAAVRQRFERPA